MIWTTPALTDAEAIRDYIARDSPRYAADLMARIVGAVERLAQFPESGRKVPELDRPDVRELIVGNYRVVYRLVRQGEVVEIALDRVVQVVKDEVSSATPLDTRRTVG
jgi:toxin ParE1/3/4